MIRVILSINPVKIIPNLQANAILLLSFAEKH